MDAVTLLAQTGERTNKIVEQIGAEQLAAETPCSEWDVRGVLNHLVGENYMFATLVNGGSLPEGEPPDMVGDDPAGAYRRSLDATLEAWRSPGALDKMLDLPMGPTPASFALNLHLMDTAVHGWDLAKGTGQDATIDPDVAGPCLAIMREVLSRGPLPVFAPSIPIGEDASLTDQLVALLGRNP